MCVPHWTLKDRTPNLILRFLFPFFISFFIHLFSFYSYLIKDRRLVAMLGNQSFFHSSNSSFLGNTLNHSYTLSQPSFPHILVPMTRKQPSADFQWLEGRRFHNIPGSPYLLPNDIDEVDRLQLQHFILRYAMQGNFRSPLDKSKVRTVLDVGCGPGTWTMEMANEFPDATITGIDISPMFPTTIIPENCQFLQHNVQQPFPFPDNSFDFVYQRLLVAGLTPDDWKKVMSELERVTKPGGWIELVEIDGVGGNNGPHMTKIWEWLNVVFSARGVDTTILTNPGLVAMMQEANLVNVSQEVLCLPTGNHGGKIGILLKENEQAFWSAITPAVIHTAGVNVDEFEDAVQEAEAEMEVYKSYHIFYIAIGQKRDVAPSTLQLQLQPQHHIQHDYMNY